MIGHRIVEDFDIEEKLYDLFWDMLRTKEYVDFIWAETVTST